MKMMSGVSEYGKLMRLSEAKYKHHGKFEGVVVRIKRNVGEQGFKSESILIKAIKNVVTGEVVSDRIWFEYTEEFKMIGRLKENDVISFETKPKPCKTRVIGKGGGVEMKVTNYTFGDPKNIQLLY